MDKRLTRMMLVCAATMPIAVATSSPAKKLITRPKVKHAKPHKVRTKGKGF